ncbi:PP2C family protein-serine/threonine phosphatase [uncultured Sphingomonas sp.]|uniref:PP2C family protein-serine/threonine phosphatase n=1 Tax=uncultured Sphingomonas sp. TaxID=158754 RepID=UPI003749B335
MNAAFFSFPGPKGDNQDAVLAPIAVNDSVYFAVADGVGGSDFGKLAAETAIHEISRRLDTYDGNAEYLFSAIRTSVVDVSKGKEAATTLTFVKLTNNVAYVAHVGDSRLYHMRNEGIVTRTNDQTEIAELIRQGVFSPIEARHYRRKNVIISAISSVSEYNLELSSFSIASGDLLVACTDGVYNVIRKSKLISINNNYPDACDAAFALREAVVEAGPVDDYSGAVFRV